MSANSHPSAVASTSARRGLQTVNFRLDDQPATGMHLNWMQCGERLSDADCDEAITVGRTFPLSLPTVVGQEQYPTHRQVDNRKIVPNETTQWIFEMLCAVAAEATQVAYGLELTTINRAPQYLEYRPGWGHFDWHNDYTHGVAEAPRKLTIIVQLSRPGDYEGGRLQMAGISVEELPDERGSVIVFPSFLYHSITPVTGGVRRALVAWVAGPRLR